MGLLLAVIVHAANIQDRDGAKYLLTDIGDWLERVIGDGGYRGKLVGWVQTGFGWTLEIVLRTAGMVGFEVLPKRRVVERAFAWSGCYRRLSQDREGMTEVSEASIHVAMIHLMLRRVHPPTAL